MNSTQLKILIKTFTSSGIIIFIFVFLIKYDSNNVNYLYLYRYFSISIFLNSIVYFIFIKWGWKLKIFYPWLVIFPNLNGDWSVQIKHKDEKDEYKDLEAKGRVHQTMFKVNITIEANESKSRTISSNFNIDFENDFNQLIYTFINTPNTISREKLEIHYGTTILNFDKNNFDKLEGCYYNDKRRRGDIKFIRDNIKK